MDGVLGQEELLQGFCQVWADERSQQEVDLVMSRMDTIGTGFINYSGRFRM